MRRLVSVAVLLVLMTMLLSPISTKAEYFKKVSMPDFGQHSTNWCWVAALANSLYWYKHTGGYTNLYPDDWDTTFIPEPPPGTDSYRKLLDEIAKKAGKAFSKPIGQNEYLNAIQKLLDSFNYGSMPKLVLHVIEEPGFNDMTIVGPTGPYETPSVTPLDYRILMLVKNPTFDDYKRELKACQDVLLWLGDDDPTTIDHIVTGVSYDDTPGAEKIDVSDPWTHNAGHDDPGPGAPDHNNSPSHTLNPYEEYQVLSKDPFTIDYPNPVLRKVLKMIFISPYVGGVVVPLDKLGMLAPYVGLASIIAVGAVVATVAYKRKKRN